MRQFLQFIFIIMVHQLFATFIKQMNQQGELLHMCSICYIQYSAEEGQGPRLDLICYNCWYNHIKTALTRITYKTGNNIISPFDKQPDIDVVTALNSLKKNDMLGLEEWLYKKYTTFTPDIQKCPSETCDYVYVGEICRFGPRSDYNCPKCSTSFQTNHSWSIKSFIGIIYFLVFAGKCPKCDIPIERISGCPHMTCPCGHEFCWHCSKDHKITNNNVYNLHSPKQCAFILTSKIFLIFLCQLGTFLTVFEHEGFNNLTKMLSLIFQIVFRGVLLDIFIFAQIYFVIFLMRPHNAFYNRNFAWVRKINKMIIISLIIVIDIIAIFWLYYIEQLSTTFCILTVEILISLVIAGFVKLIIISQETWFAFIT